MMFCWLFTPSLRNFRAAAYCGQVQCSDWLNFQSRWLRTGYPDKLVTWAAKIFYCKKSILLAVQINTM